MRCEICVKAASGSNHGPILEPIPCLSDSLGRIFAWTTQPLSPALPGKHLWSLYLSQIEVSLKGMLPFLLVATALTGLPPASDTCAAGLHREWPGIVDGVYNADANIDRGRSASTAAPSRSSDAQRTLAAKLETLESTCAGQPDKLAYIRSLIGELRLTIRDFQGALSALSRTPLDAGSDLVGRNAQNWLQSAASVGDTSAVAEARTAVRAVHQAALEKAGWVVLPGAQSGRFSLDGFSAPANPSMWIFIGWSDGQPYPIALSVQQTDAQGSGPLMDARLTGCNESTGPTEKIANTAAKPSDILDFAKSVYANEKEMKALDGDSSWGGDRHDCLNFKDVLPGFRDMALIAGDEFADPQDDPSEDLVMRLQIGSSRQQSRAADAIMRHPELVNPFALPLMIAALMRQGDMERAAFWYYFWQVRSEPSARLGAPDGEQALRSSFSMMLGAPINAWIGSDMDAMLDVMKRAYAFERKVALYAGRPSGVDARTWQQAVAAARSRYDWPVIETAFEKLRATWSARREQNHLPNGPLKNAGKPLLDSWR